MKNCIVKNDNVLNISFYKINFEKVKKLLKILGIDNVSIFIDEGQIYSFYKYVSAELFDDYVLKINNSILIFNDNVKECSMDKELDILLNKKILIDYNLSDSLTHILINLKNVEISKKEIKKILK